MRLARYTQFVRFDIRSPRYRDRVVLLKAVKVGDHNKITFSEAPSMGTDPYYISGAKVKKYKKEQMRTKLGTEVTMYAVPIDDLEKLELINDYKEVF